MFNVYGLAIAVISNGLIGMAQHSGSVLVGDATVLHLRCRRMSCPIQAGQGSSVLSLGIPSGERLGVVIAGAIELREEPVCFAGFDIFQETSSDEPAMDGQCSFA